MEIPTGAEVHETSLAKCWIGADGIFYSVSKSGDRSLENFREYFTVLERVSDNGRNKFCVMSDITETQLLSKEVRQFVAAEAEKYVKAMALVSRSPIGTTAGNVFEMMSSPSYPVANFQDYGEAMKWLRQFVR